MMQKPVYYLLILMTLFGCNGDKVDNCFQNAGDIITKDFNLSGFDKITVFERIELILIEGPEFKVQLETGEYLENDISASVENGRLILRNENACNILREYGLTKFFVTAPNITEIRNSSGLTVTNEGILNYPNLSLISEDFEEEDFFHTDGHFRLSINSESLIIVVNNLSHMFIDGSVDNLSVNIFSGDARFELNDLIVQDLQILHRGTNDVIVRPMQSARGELRSTGDLILLNNPPIVEVDQLYTGRVIIQD